MEKCSGGEQCNSKPECFLALLPLVLGGFARNHVNGFHSRRSTFLTTSRGVLARRTAFCRLAQVLVKSHAFYEQSTRNLLTASRYTLSLSSLFRYSLSIVCLSLLPFLTIYPYRHQARSITVVVILAPAWTATPVKNGVNEINVAARCYCATGIFPGLYVLTLNGNIVSSIFSWTINSDTRSEARIEFSIDFWISRGSPEE